MTSGREVNPDSLVLAPGPKHVPVLRRGYQVI